MHFRFSKNYRQKEISKNRTPYNLIISLLHAFVARPEKALPKLVGYANNHLFTGLLLKKDYRLQPDSGFLHTILLLISAHIPQKHDTANRENPGCNICLNRLYSFSSHPVMKHFVLLISAVALFLICPFGIHAQDNYWQQKVDYKIEVKLNDTLHELNAFITIDYKNNSPQTLDFIYIHLWPNAYRDQGTPMSKQMIENGKTSFWYSKPEQRGFIDRLDFKLNAEVCQYQFNDDKEICKLTLNKPLKPGERCAYLHAFSCKAARNFFAYGPYRAKLPDNPMVPQTGGV